MGEGPGVRSGLVRLLVFVFLFLVTRPWRGSAAYRPKAIAARAGRIRQRRIARARNKKLYFDIKKVGRREEISLYLSYH